MAIYHLSHKSIGRSTHDEGTAGAHLGYITRSGTCDLVIGQHMPIPRIGAKGGTARKWLDEQEASDRKNARVIDKLTLALPHELNAKQQVELVRNFATSMTNGEAPYLAAFHRENKDAENQHCHLVLRDRHFETGKRVWGNEDRKPTEIMREKWEEATNAALQKARVNARVDHRSLEDQGIDREPTKHIGPTAKAIEADGRHSWKVKAVREDEIEKNAKREVAKSKARALDPKGLDTKKGMPFLKKKTPQKTISGTTADLINAASFLERLWENVSVVKDEALRFAENTYRASLSALRGYIFPDPLKMDEDTLRKESDRLEALDVLSSGKFGDLYKPATNDDRLQLVEQHSPAESWGWNRNTFTNGLKDLRQSKMDQWRQAPDDADANILAVVLSQTLENFIALPTRTDENWRLDPAERPRDEATNLLGEMLNLDDLNDTLRPAFEATQQDIRDDIRRENERKAQKAEDRRRYLSSPEHQRHLAKVETDRVAEATKQKTIEDVQRRIERGAERLEEGRREKRAQKAREDALRAAEAAKQREIRNAEIQAEAQERAKQQEANLDRDDDRGTTMGR